MDKMTKKQGIKNHGIKAELKASLERTRTDRSALATATCTPRWCCRPRGRRAFTASSRRSQDSRVGLLVAQGTNGAMKGVAATGKALRRQHGLAGVGQWRREKQSRENKEERRRRRPYSAARKQREATKEPSPCQRKTEDGHARAWNREEGRRRRGGFGGYCSPKLPNCHLF